MAGRSSRRQWDIDRENQFRTAVRQLIEAGRYPLHGELVVLLGRPDEKRRSGLSSRQSEWRRRELATQGYDVDASVSQRRLVRAR
jgi:hypothetical protein